MRQPWSLEHSRGDIYAVTNTRNAPAYDVHLDLGQLHGTLRDVLDHAEVEPGSVVTFMTARTMDVSDDTVTVTWAAQ